LRQKGRLSWSLWGATTGIVLAALLVILFRITQSPIILNFFMSVDKIAFLLASSATSWVFPGDRVQRIVSIATFFDVVLILASGLQCALLGYFAALLISRKTSA
jgi:hypothetical protein